MPGPSLATVRKRRQRARVAALEETATSSYLHIYSICWSEQNTTVAFIPCFLLRSYLFSNLAGESKKYFEAVINVNAMLC